MQGETAGTEDGSGRPAPEGLFGLFELLGVDAAAEAVYRHTLTVEAATAGEVAAALGTDEEAATAALARLVDVGLLLQVAEGGRFTSVDPRSAVRGIADRQAERADRLREAIPQLAAVFDDARRAEDEPTVTRILSGADAIADWYGRLGHEVREEFMAFDKPPYVLSAAESLEGLAIRRGVRWRAVYGASSFDGPGRLAQVRHDVAAGEQARITRSVPVKLAIVDRRVALVSLSHSPERPEALVTESGPLVEALSGVFEAYWERAERIRPWEDVPERSSVGWESTAGGPAHRPPTPAEQELLALLAAEVKDEVIARELGISTRTLSRRIQDLLTELGATSRFRAGVEAVRRSWL